MTENNLTPFVMMCYSSAHYHLPDDRHDSSYDDLESLIAVSTKAAVECFQLKPGDDLNKTLCAFSRRRTACLRTGSPIRIGLSVLLMGLSGKC